MKWNELKIYYIHLSQKWFDNVLSKCYAYYHQQEFYGMHHSLSAYKGNAVEAEEETAVNSLKQQGISLLVDGDNDIDADLTTFHFH